jgi:hypothetical protein
MPVLQPTLKAAIAPWPDAGNSEADTSLMGDLAEPGPVPFLVAGYPAIDGAGIPDVMLGSVVIR